MFYNKKWKWKNEKDLDHFWHRELTLKVRILPFLTTFTQLTARLKNFLMGLLLVLGLKEGLLECVTACVKSEVILLTVHSVCIEVWPRIWGRLFFMKPWRFDIRYRSSMEKCQLAWSRSRIKYFLNVQISFILQHGNEIMNPNLQCFIHSSVYLTIAYKPFLLDTI